MRISPIDWSATEVRATLHAGARAHTFGFRANATLSPDVDAFLPLGLLPAMRLGASLEVEADVSKRLVAGAYQVQDILHRWDSRFGKVEIRALGRERGPVAGREVACFFSGGVDSFYTLLKHRDEITHLIFMRGFDLPLEDSPVTREATRMARDVAAELGKSLIEVDTDIRSFCDHYVEWKMYHGAILGAVSLLFQRSFRRIYIPASHTFAQLFAWGSHPLLDPLWSTELVEVVHDGCEARRIDKVGAISSDPTAMRWLRVCWENRESAYNCGRCEKCLRTMINLRVHGALGRCRTLPDTIDVRATAQMAVNPPNGMAFAEENLAALRCLGEESSLARALAEAMRRSRRRSLMQSMKQAAPAPVKRAARSPVGRAAKSVRRRVARAADRAMTLRP